MYDPFEGIEPADNQENNAGSDSGLYDPFGDIQAYKPPEETSFTDKLKAFGQKVYEQADRTTTNIENALPSYIGKVGKAAQAYGQEVSQAATRAYEARAGGEEINDEDPTSGYEGPDYGEAKAGLYDAAVGTPAGYVAITPFVPAPVRGAAGLLAAPTIVHGTMNAYDQNVAKDDGTPVISTAKQTLLDPVIDPIKEAVTQPGKYVQEIVDNPLSVWDKVFLPASMVEGGAKLAPRRVKDAVKTRIDSAADRVRGIRGDDLSGAGETGFDDLAGNGEGTKAMRSDVYDPFGDVEPASQGSSTGFDDLSRASVDNAASYDAPPADVSAPVFNVAGDADWAGMNDSTKAAANELVSRWNAAHPEAPVEMTSGKRSGDGTSHHDVGEAVDFVSDSFEGEAGRPLRDEFGRMASDMGLTPFDEYNGSGNEAYARGENFHVTVPRDWQGSGRSVADMADDRGYGFDDGMRDASDVADDADGGMYEETGDMATDVYNRYRQDGLTDAEAAGMTGNIAQESGFDAGAVSNDGYSTRALIQWDGDRYARFEKWCDDNGRDPSDWRAQVDYSVEEMKTTEPDALRRMRERGDDLTPEEAARIIREDYERPDPAQANDAHRMDVARRVYDQGGRRQSASLDDRVGKDVAGKGNAQTIQRMDTIRSMRNDVDYTAHEDSGVPVTRQGIVDYVNRLFNATIRYGRTEKGARGQFNTLSHVIRTQNFAEPRVIAHELGHFLDERFHFSEAPEYAGELLHLVDDRFGKGGYSDLDMSGRLAEGFAEFFHDYVTDRAQARRNAPEFYNYFEKKLHQDPKLTGATNKLTDVMYKWNHQGSVARVKGHISFASDSTGFQGLKNMLKDGTFGEAGKKAWSRLYTEAVDELHPLSDVVAAVEKRIGKKLPFSSNPFLNAWAARGWAGKAITLLQHGDPERGIPALKDIFHSVGKKNLKDFSAFLVALREKDIYDFNGKLKKGEEGSALKATVDPIDAGMTIRELAKKHPEFVEAAKNLYRFQQHLIDELVNAGMLSAKAAADMRKRWPHYVPFQRIVDGIDAPSVGGKKFVNVGNTIQKFKGSSRDIVDPLESVISNTFRVVSAIERNKVGQSFVRLSKMKGMGDLCEEVKGTPKATDSTFYVWEGGKKKTYATSPELLKALKMTNEEGMSMLVKVLRVPAGFLRSGATLSPEFILRNPVRDMISASLYSKHGFIPVWDTMRGLALYLKKGKEYWDYMNSGAAQSAMVSLDRDYLHGQMRDLLKKKSVLSMCANPIEALRAFSEATEMATRLAEFDLAKKGYTGIGNRLFGKERKPLSNVEAGIEARDITLDFGRHGKRTQSWNQTVAFFNAAIQGTDKMVREFKEHPGQMLTKTFIGITLPSLVLWYLNKDDPRYQELPQWQKDIFWVIPGKDTLYKIPKPFELGILFGTVPERMMQYMYDKEKGRNGPGFKGLGSSILENLAPSIIPTGFLPAAEWMSNYSFFMDRNIVPLSQSKLPDRQQYGPYTSYLARKLGNAFNLSPRKIDNTIQDVGGNLAALGNSLIDQAAGLSETRPAKRASEMPGVRGFTATPYASSDSVQRLRDDFSQQEKLYNEFKMTKKKPEGYDGAKYIKYKSAMDAMNNTYRAERKVMESKRLNSAEKRERIDRIKMQQTNIARRALGLSKVSNE